MGELRVAAVGRGEVGGQQFEGEVMDGDDLRRRAGRIGVGRERMVKDVGAGRPSAPGELVLRPALILERVGGAAQAAAPGACRRVSATVSTVTPPSACSAATRRSTYTAVPEWGARRA